jgi:hypothetical protein
MHSLWAFSGSAVAAMMRESGYSGVQQTDITENVKPTLEKFYSIAKITYLPIKWFGLQDNFPNASAAYYFLDLVNQGLIKYFVTTGEKATE